MFKCNLNPKYINSSVFGINILISCKQIWWSKPTRLTQCIPFSFGHTVLKLLLGRFFQQFYALYFVFCIFTVCKGVFTLTPLL